MTANGKFTKRGSASAGQTAAFAVAGLSMPSLVLGGTNVVTAVKAQNGTLELIDWFVDAGGSVLREGSIAAGPITQLAVAPVGSGRVVTLTQDSTGSTKLIAWDVSAAGQFTRRGDVTVGTGNGVVKVTAVSATQVVTAIRTTAGALQVNAFSLTQAGVWPATGQALGPAITDTSIVSGHRPRGHGLAPRERQPRGLGLGRRPDGQGRAGSSSDAGAVDEIALGALGSAKVATAGRQADKTLEVIVWDVVSAVTRLQSNQAGGGRPDRGRNARLRPCRDPGPERDRPARAYRLGRLLARHAAQRLERTRRYGLHPLRPSPVARQQDGAGERRRERHGARRRGGRGFRPARGREGLHRRHLAARPQVVLDNAGSAPGTDQPSPSGRCCRAAGHPGRSSISFDCRRPAVRHRDRGPLDRVLRQIRPPPEEQGRRTDLPQCLQILQRLYRPQERERHRQPQQHQPPPAPTADLRRDEVLRSEHRDADALHQRVLRHQGCLRPDHPPLHHPLGGAPPYLPGRDQRPYRPPLLRLRDLA